MFSETVTRMINQQLKTKGISARNFSIRECLRFTPATKAILEDPAFLAYVSLADNRQYAARALMRQIIDHLYSNTPFIELNGVKQDILFSICESLLNDVKRGYRVWEVERKHLQRLKAWLELVYDKQSETLSRPTAISDTPAYREYTAELQMKVLQLDCQMLKEPLLDIGCGSSGHLINYLREQKIEAFGLDRVADDSVPYFVQTFWWDYSFEKEQWGTITAHLSFSSHFLRAHLLGSTYAAEYANVYRKILGALRKGGSFHYAPGLPFMERWLDKSRYHVRPTTKNEAFHGIIVTKK